MYWSTITPASSTCGADATQRQQIDDMSRRQANRWYYYQYSPEVAVITHDWIIKSPVITQANKSTWTATHLAQDAKGCFRTANNQISPKNQRETSKSWPCRNTNRNSNIWMFHIFLYFVTFNKNYVFNARKSMIFSIGLNGNFLRFRRDGVSISYTVICLSHFDVCLAIT
jgi:hypothetical protein